MCLLKLKWLHVFTGRTLIPVSNFNFLKSVAICFNGVLFRSVYFRPGAYKVNKQSPVELCVSRVHLSGVRSDGLGLVLVHHCPWWPGPAECSWQAVRVCISEQAVRQGPVALSLAWLITDGLVFYIRLRLACRPDIGILVGTGLSHSG